MSDLASIKIWRVRISLDGLKFNHEWLRGKNTFEQTVRAIKMLSDAGISTKISMVVHRRNINEIEQVGNLARSLGVYEVRLLPFVPIGRGKKIRKIMLTPKQWKDLMSKLDEISNRVKVPICIDSPLEGLLKGKGYLNPCVCGYLYLGISSNGDAFPCPIMTDVKIGNIRKESIVEIWNSDVIKNLRDASQLKGACASCTYKMRCNGGCRALAYYIKGDYTCPDPFCWIASQKKC